jgi:hypothetical protein
MKRKLLSPKDQILARWYEEDYPNGNKRFQIKLLGKDIAIFLLIPLCAVLFFKIIESGETPTKNSERRKITSVDNDNLEKHSQIINFNHGHGTNGSGFSRRAPGTLVKVRLMNVVETFSSAPVHAQIVDNSLGRDFFGGTLIGDASPETGSGRISITFKFARYPRRLDLAVPIAARAMSLDGTFGLLATKKEGFFARAAIRSAATNPNAVDTGTDKQDMNSLIARALAAGLMQEFQGEASTAHSNAQVLTLKPMTEFYVELTDYFPGKQ